MSKVLWRLMPFLMALYVVNILDRANLSYVALDMNKDLNITAIAYGALAGAFFIGYLFFEVPSNILLEKFGANKIMARIMVSWGIVTILMFFATAYWHMYTLRLLLGVMEAGFFPGIVFYLSQWVPPKLRGRAVTFFFIGSQVGTAFSAPLATWVMDNVRWFDVSGWRWVFMIEGVPAVILGVIAFFFLTNKPKDATWLTLEERTWLTETLEAERVVNKPANRGALQAFRSLRVWHLAVIYLLFQAGTQGMAYWAPTLVKGFSQAFSNSMVGIILMIPPTLAIIVMLFWGRRSDRVGERKFHALVPILMAVVGISLAATGGNVALQVTGMIIYGASYPAFYGIFWTIPTVYLTGAEAAVGIAIINTASSASTFGASNALGFISNSWGGVGVLTMTGACLALSALFLLVLQIKDRMLQSGAAQTDQSVLDNPEPSSI